MKRTALLSVILAVTFATSHGRASDVVLPYGVERVSTEFENYYRIDDETPVADDNAANGQVEPDYTASTCGEAASPSCGCGAAESSCDSCCDPCGGCCDDCCCMRLRDYLPDGNDCFGWRLPCCAGDPWKLFNPCCDRWSFGGWVSGGITTNSHGAKNNGPVAFVSTNELLMNQLWFYGERKADTGGCGWDWGVRIDYIFGADGPDTQAFGDQSWDFGWNSGGLNNPGHTYGSAIPQIYGEVAYNDVTVKMGRFYTIIGYEVVQATGNFFYSHAYTMNYGEPFTHTGALGEWSVDDETTLYGGYVAGWDTGWSNLIDAHMYMGGVRMNWWDDATFTYAFTVGDNGTNQGDLYMQSLLLDYTITDNWNYIFQSDFAAQTNIPGGARNNHWYGVNQYLFYTINDCWKSGLRFEWFNDEDGARVAGDFAGRGDYFALTAGLNYKPRPNLNIRPEVRYDWFDGEVAGAAPFGDNMTYDEQLTFALDVIFTY